MVVVVVLVLMVVVALTMLPLELPCTTAVSLTRRLPADAQFMSNLSVAFERQGMEVYVDGHTYIKLMAQTHEKSLPGAPRVMTVSSRSSRVLSQPV